MALTADRQTVDKQGGLVDYPVEGGVKIFKGALLKFNANGFIEPVTAEASATFAGIAFEAADNTDGGDGDITCRVVKEGSVLLTGTGFTQAQVDDLVYAEDDEDVAIVQGANLPEVGKIAEFVSATEVFVDLGARYRTNK